MSPASFLLGTDEPSWLERLDVPLFVSHRRLSRKGRKTFPRALGPWALDSGGFTELSTFGEWRTSPATYVSAVRRYAEEIGNLAWAAPQDWMVEPVMLAKTGLSVREHQLRTVSNFLELRLRAPELPFAPVLQGWTRDDYLACADLYARAGVDLEREPVVGVGSVCRRQDTGHARHIMTSLARLRLRIHGFGIKVEGIRVYGESIASADSMAWSYSARKKSAERRRLGRPRPPCGKRTCAHCTHYALEWREKALRSAAEARPEPLALFDL